MQRQKNAPDQRSSEAEDSDVEEHDAMDVEPLQGLPDSDSEDEDYKEDASVTPSSLSEEDQEEGSRSTRRRKSARYAK